MKTRSLEKLKANQLQGLVRQFSVGLSSIEVAVQEAADMKIRYSDHLALGSKCYQLLKAFCDEGVIFHVLP